MEPTDFFAVAAVLANADEPRSRSAVSRLYYGCHHEACAVLALTPPVRGRHAWVISRIRESGNAEAARLLHALKIQRERADYDLPAPWSDELPRSLLDADAFGRSIGTVR